MYVAMRAAAFVRKQLYDDAKKVLVRNYRAGRSSVEGREALRAEEGTHAQRIA